MSFINSTNWRAGMQTVSATIDQTFGETILLIPCERRPNAQARPQREHAVELLGVFGWRSEMALRTGNIAQNRGEGGGLVETRKPVVSFSHAALPWALAHGDRVERCCDGELFEVTKIEPDGVSRVCCHLVQLGRSEQ